jgi:hypothetical protein
MNQRPESRRAATRLEPKLLGALIVILAATGCTNSDTAARELIKPPVAWLELRESTAVRQLTLDHSVCRACIRLEEVAVLGRTSDPDAAVNYAFRVYRDSKARYWVGQGSEIKLFDSTGKYLRNVGSAGSGPGEWRSPWFATDSAGHIEIVDASNGRATKLDGGFKVERETPMPGLQINSIAPSGPSEFVVNAWAVASDMVGEPIHLFDDGKAIRSFGGRTAGVLNDLTAQRVLTGDGRGHVFSAKPYAYEIEAWTTAGERITGVSGPPLNQHKVLPGHYDFDRNPLASQIRGIRPDGFGRLWVVTRHIKPDWKTKFDEVRTPDGGKMISPKAGVRGPDYQFSRIELVDMAAGKIVAQLDVPQSLVGFAGASELWENTRTGDDTPFIRIWRLTSLGIEPPMMP